MTDSKKSQVAFHTIALAKFGSVGVVNTALTFLLYQVLLLVMDYRIAYAISFATGIVISAFGASRFVFRTQLTLRRFAAFAVFYGLSFLVGLGLLYLLVQYAGLLPQLAPLLVVAAMLPVNYVGARLLLGTSRPQPELAQSEADPLSKRRP